MPSDFAVHSDLLVHWTGKDIDEKLHPGWYEKDSTMPPEATAAYLARLRRILEFGLWLTSQPEWKTRAIKAPEAPALCFTELKLSQTRQHAFRYGRLGIAVKRPFVFQRLGRPVIYYQDRGPDSFATGCSRDLKNKRLLQFFKPMGPSGTRRLTYELYSESEWRILGDLPGQRCLVDPRSTQDAGLTAYLADLPSAEREKLRYLAPLDGWFAAIIYPDISVKGAAHADDEIRELIAAIKRRGSLPEAEHSNWPVELDLDLCKNL